MLLFLSSKMSSRSHMVVDAILSSMADFNRSKNISCTYFITNFPEKVNTHKSSHKLF